MHEKVVKELNDLKSDMEDWQEAVKEANGFIAFLEDENLTLVGQIEVLEDENLTLIGELAKYEEGR